MSSFLWLLLYLAPLLGLTAAVFGWLGWHWHSSDLQKRVQELEAQIGETQTRLREAEARHAAAQNEDDALAATATAEREQAKQELQGLRGELQAAKAAALQQQDEAGKARATAQTLEAESTRLTAELATMRAEHAAALADLTTAQTKVATTQAELTTTQTKLNSTQANRPPAQRPGPSRRGHTRRSRAHTCQAEAETQPRGQAEGSRRRLFAGKNRRAGAAAGQTAGGHLDPHAGADDWQRRIAKLEGKSPPDAAELALARRSFADSEKRLATTTAEIEQLQNQTRVLGGEGRAPLLLPVCRMTTSRSRASKKSSASSSAPTECGPGGRSPSGMRAGCAPSVNCWHSKTVQRAKNGRSRRVRCMRLRTALSPDLFYLPHVYSSASSLPASAAPTARRLLRQHGNTG
ncbi:MAG: hypothetical protein QM767_06515 [Anaeromyxobacter sp.]